MADNLLKSYTMKLLVLFFLFSSISVFAQQDTGVVSNNTTPTRYSMWGLNGKAIQDSVRKQLDTARAKVGVASRAGFIALSGTLLADTFSVTGISNGAVTLSMASWLSANGFTGMRILSVTPYQNPGSTTTAPIVSMTAWTTTTASFLVRQQNASVVSILGINVLSGLPLVGATDATTIKLYVSFVAY